MFGVATVSNMNALHLRFYRQRVNITYVSGLQAAPRVCCSVHRQTRRLSVCGAHEYIVYTASNGLRTSFVKVRTYDQGATSPTLLTRSFAITKAAHVLHARPYVVAVPAFVD